MRTFAKILLWLSLTGAVVSLGYVGFILAVHGVSFDLPEIDRDARTALVVFGIPLLAGLPVVIFLWAEAVARVRRRRGMRVVGHLESAVRLSAPLPGMIRAVSESEGKGLARRLGELADALSRGEPLGDALRRTVPEVPVRQVELIAVAERTGRLGQTLADMVRQEARDQQGKRGWIDWLYPLIIAYALALVLSGVMVFIAPKFQEIFADFDVAMPNISIALLGGPNLVPVMQWVLIALLVFGVAATGWALLRATTLPRATRAAAYDTLSGVALRVPLLGAVVRDRQLGDICYAVSAALRAAVPLPSALVEAQSLRISPAMRRRVLRWADRIREGRPNPEAARDAGMPALMVGMLATGQAAAEPAEAFEFLHRYYGNRFSRAVELARGAVVPFAVLVMGTTVGWVVLATFIPIITLINRVAGEWGT